LLELLLMLNIASAFPFLSLMSVVEKDRINTVRAV